MVVSINQPAYLPWLGYFDRIARSQIHIVLDHVQFEKNSFTNRNKIRIKEGACWLTVPVKTKGRFGHLQINTVEIADINNWPQKHWQSLLTNYGKAPYFGQHRAFFEGVYAKRFERLIDLNRVITEYLLDAFSIGTRILYSSELPVEGTKSALVLNLCQQIGATSYLSGPLGRGYLVTDSFTAADITLDFHDYAHPVYSQVFPGFEPYMTAVDLLFNHGPDAKKILSESSPTTTS